VAGLKTNCCNRLAKVNPNQISATIISYEEQTRGWLSHISKARNLAAQVEIYKQLKGVDTG